MRGDGEEEVPNVGGLQARKKGDDSVYSPRQLKHVFVNFCVQKKVTKFGRKLILTFCVRPTAMPSKMACRERASMTRKPRRAT